MTTRNALTPHFAAYGLVVDEPLLAAALPDLIAQLPERERYALMADGDAPLAAEFGVTTARIVQLRKQGRQRLIELALLHVAAEPPTSDVFGAWLLHEQAHGRIPQRVAMQLRTALARVQIDGAPALLATRARMREELALPGGGVIGRAKGSGAAGLAVVGRVVGE